MRKKKHKDVKLLVPSHAALKCQSPIIQRQTDNLATASTEPLCVPSMLRGRKEGTGQKEDEGHDKIKEFFKTFGKIISVEFFIPNVTL